MPVNLQQTGGGGGGGTTLTGTGLARQTGACTELSGDVTTSGSNATTLKNTGTAGSYTKVTTDAQGRVSSGTTLGYVDLPQTSGGTVVYEEDFISGPGTALTVSAGSGNRWDRAAAYAPLTSGTTGTISANTAGTFINPGQILLTTPATSGSGINLVGGTGANQSGNGCLGAPGSNAPWQTDIWLLLPSTITNYCIRAGMLPASTNADPSVNGMWVEYDTANASSNSTFMLRTVNASTSTYVSTGVTPVASTWYHIRVSSSVSGTISAQVGASNGALSGAVTSNTNVTSANEVPGIQLIPRTTAAVTVTLDRISYVATIGRA